MPKQTQKEKSHKLVTKADAEVGLIPKDRDGNPMVPGQHGGWKRGLPPDVAHRNSLLGRPPSLVRKRLLLSFDERVGWLTAIADGEPLETTRFWCPECETTVLGRTTASVKERLMALEVMAKYSMGSTMTLTDKDGNDLPMTGGYDFSKLNAHEMAELERLLQKARKV